ncbi:rubredoxin [Rhodocytophaga aerolata]|uniref:Rubredoxin n=1 Tax=Rhodocytophaga aerolata TaxID=455078 RepID=A0ABT8R3R8_9BACT|nr:rubredoxin [Rhodocytophaga aerolata]MDO1446747.1 rubredoxin [Rhodocytophaga aerolata]
MASNITLRLFTNGGIITPEEVRKVIEIARMCGCDSIIPGSRQEVYLQLEKVYLPIAEKELSKNALKYTLVEDSKQNIVTSFAALQILPTTAWLLGDTYLDILDSFVYQPRLKINIVDPLQNLVPLFTGELNFIASSYPRYWHLYVNFSFFGKRQIWPVLIDGEDIVTVSKLIEEVYFQQQLDTIQDLYLAVSHTFTGRTRQWEEELQLTAHSFPVIEGMYSYGNSYWLGIYRRNQSFPLSFLEALYNQCIESKIGKICLTPHQTLLITDIKAEHKAKWEKLLGLHQIHNHHSALEVNWQIPDLEVEAQRLKNTWVRELEEKEVYTTGLSFAIQTKPMDVTTSVLIRQTSEAGQTRYDILHTHDFSTHSLQWQVFATNLSEQVVASVLINLCQLYYTQVDQHFPSIFSEEKPVFIATHDVYQCSDCLTVYDPEFGDEAAAIPASTAFEELPDSYVCSLCEASKQRFVALKKEEAVTR